MLNKKQINKQTYKQTNKQTNKQINILLNPKYLSQIKSDLHKIFRVTYCGCPKMVKTKKQISKQANKETNKQFLDLKYISKIEG